MIMGATEILQILRRNGELTTLEISEKSNCSMSSVKQAMKRLLKDVSENLEFRILTQEEKEDKYGHKLGCRIRVYWLN